MTWPTDEPAVLAWMIALAGDRRPRPASPGRHWWRELVTNTYRDSRDAWEALRESAQPAPSSVPGVAHSSVAMHQLEDDDFRRAFPPPTFRDVLTGLSGRWDLEEVLHRH